ncbi:MAG: peptidoglycan editing factor PgeF [Acaryochloridaceae cyanobacterium SU_2_1]|nr:peptidoglycan editing factor PgeF [Acaryochloridaceae cyanobacterium SU_2_1]
MHNWTWQSCEGRSYLTCSLLESWSHGFFSRDFWPDSPRQLGSIIQPEAQSYRVKQVHGNEVLSTAAVQAHGQQWAAEAQSAAEAEQGPEFLEADGLYSHGPAQALWVCTADCTPVLIADRNQGGVAAVHAGWRGTAAKIVPLALAQMQAQGSQLQDIRVALGPAIGGDVYQVTTAVAAQVVSTVLAPDLLSSARDPDQIAAMLLQEPNSPLIADQQPGHVRLDVRRVNAMQLEQLGVLPAQIAIAPHCTYQQPEKFFSYRREQRQQVQWSGIVSR